MAKMSKMSSEKKRRRKSKRWEKSIKKEEAVHKESIQKEISMYNTVRIFNYPFFGVLLVFIIIVCWKTNSLLVLTISIVLFGFLLFLHHTARVEKNERTLIWDYREALSEMKVYCAVGILVFAVLIASAFYLPRIF